MSTVYITFGQRYHRETARRHITPPGEPFALSAFECDEQPDTVNPDGTVNE